MRPWIAWSGITGDCRIEDSSYDYRQNDRGELLPSDERIRIGEEQLAGKHQGFLTSRGRFVEREEAKRIATLAGQTETENSQLFSEDLY